MDVFEYKEYRALLKAWLLTEKKGNRYNATTLSKKVRVHPTFISQVLKGNKDLNIEQWMLIYNLMALTSIEKEYAHFLLLFNRAGSKEAQLFYQKKLHEILKKKSTLKIHLKDYAALSEKDRAIYYSSWLYSAIRLSCAFDGGQKIEQLAKKFKLTKTKTEEILSFLCSTELCKKVSEKYHMGEQHIHISPDSPLIINHHKNWRLRAINSLEHTSLEELNFTAPMSISRKDFPVIKEKIFALIKDSIETAKDSEAEDLAVLNIDFFWAIK